MTVTLAACGSSDAGPTPEVVVELASVTLGDDCGNALPPPAKLADAKDAQERRRAPDADLDAARSSGHNDCAQTSMQLLLKTNAATKATTIKIKKVELLDDKGKLLEVMASRLPSKWNGKKYDKWTEAVGPSETLQTSYILATPNWDKLVKGRYNAQTKKFLVRVTVTVGTKDRTIEKSATVAAMIEPQIDT